MPFFDSDDEIDTDYDIPEVDLMDSMSEDTVTLAALVATVKALQTEVHQMRQDLTRRDDRIVPRREFESWRSALDEKYMAMRRELEREVEDRKASRTPWWHVAAIVISAGALALTILLNLDFSA